MKSIDVGSLYFLLHSIVFASEKDVLDHIFEDYDVRVRPVKNASLPMICQVDLILIRLIEVNDKQEYITLILSVDQYWKDEFLNWDPKDYGGTETITVASTAVWLPDILVKTTSSKSQQIISKDKQMVTLNYDGSIYFTHPFVLSNYCPMKTDNFPYDQQNCIITISSWYYTNKILKFELLRNGTTSNIEYENSEWNIDPYKGESKDWFGGVNHYTELDFTLTISRKSTYYVWVLIIPTFVITALSIAGIFAPFNNIGDREEKITLGLTTLLTLAVILSMVTGEMPRETNLPLLGIFVLVEIAIVVSCMAISAVILFLHQRATTRFWLVPNCMSFLLCNSGKQTSETDIVLSMHQTTRAHDLYGTETNLNFSLNYDKHDGNNISEVRDENSMKLNDAIAKIIANMAMKRQEMKAREDEEIRKYQWLILFDHVDLILFASFQVIHVVLYVVTFNH